MPAYPSEPDAPTYDDPFPRVQLSEYSSWHEIATWGARLFEPRGPPSVAMTAWVDEARRGTASPEAFLLRATRFVQDEVRYVAIEVGMSRRRPTDAATVLSRRFGDCKDKTALLVALLRAYGMTARPALVSSRWGHTLDEWAASPAAFDHAIVSVTSAAGVPMWIDPTAVLQGGGVDRFAYSPYERALILDPQSTGLQELVAEPVIEPTASVCDRFRVGRPGTSQETSLDSVRTYRGAWADVMRQLFKARTDDDIFKHYLHLYQSDFPAIRGAGPLEAFDDRDHNLLRVVLHLVIPEVWQRLQDATHYRFELPAAIIERELPPRPANEDRHLPLSIPFPMHSHYQLVAELPFGMENTSEAETVDEPSFRFAFTPVWNSPELTYDYDIATRRSEVSVGEVRSYIKAVDDARLKIRRVLTYLEPAPDRPNWPLIGLLAVCVPAAAWGSRRAYFWSPPPRVTGDLAAPPEGLSGGLMALGLSLGWVLVERIVHAVDGAKYLVSRATFDQLSPPWRALLMAGTIVNLTLGAYATTLLILLFRKRRTFPTHLVVFAVILALCSLIDSYARSAANAARAPSIASALSRDSLRLVVWAASWGTYVRVSRRVAATFVR